MRKGKRQFIPWKARRIGNSRKIRTLHNSGQCVANARDFRLRHWATASTKHETRNPKEHVTMAKASKNPSKKNAVRKTAGNANGYMRRVTVRAPCERGMVGTAYSAVAIVYDLF
jgi:hypothetical protein